MSSKIAEKDKCSETVKLLIKSFRSRWSFFKKNQLLHPAKAVLFYRPLSLSSILVFQTSQSHFVRNSLTLYEVPRHIVGKETHKTHPALSYTLESHHPASLGSFNGK